MYICVSAYAGETVSVLAFVCMCVWCVVSIRISIFIGSSTVSDLENCSRTD